MLTLSRNGAQSRASRKNFLNTFNITIRKSFIPVGLRCKLASDLFFAEFLSISKKSFSFVTTYAHINPSLHLLTFHTSC